MTLVQFVCHQKWINSNNLFWLYVSMQRNSINCSRRHQMIFRSILLIDSRSKSLCHPKCLWTIDKVVRNFSKIYRTCAIKLININMCDWISVCPCPVKIILCASSYRMWAIINMSFTTTLTQHNHIFLREVCIFHKKLSSSEGKKKKINVASGKKSRPINFIV